MNELITLKCKSKTGNIIETQVAEILEIDGKPYRSAETDENIIQLVNHLSGRVASLETILGQLLRQGE